MHFLSDRENCSSSLGSWQVRIFSETPGEAEEKTDISLEEFSDIRLGSIHDIGFKLGREAAQIYRWGEDQLHYGRSKQPAEKILKSYLTLFSEGFLRGFSEVFVKRRKTFLAEQLLKEEEEEKKLKEEEAQRKKPLELIKAVLGKAQQAEEE